MVRDHRRIDLPYLNVTILALASVASMLNVGCASHAPGRDQRFQAGVVLDRGLSLHQVRGRIASVYGRQDQDETAFHGFKKEYRAMYCAGTSSAVLVRCNKERRAQEYRLLKKFPGGVWFSDDDFGAIGDGHNPAGAKVARIGSPRGSVFRYGIVQVYFAGCCALGNALYDYVGMWQDRALLMYLTEDRVSRRRVFRGFIEVSGPYERVRLERDGPKPPVRKSRSPAQGSPPQQP